MFSFDSVIQRCRILLECQQAAGHTVNYKKSNFLPVVLFLSLFYLCSFCEWLSCFLKLIMMFLYFDNFLSAQFLHAFNLKISPIWPPLNVDMTKVKENKTARLLSYHCGPCCPLSSWDLINTRGRCSLSCAQDVLKSHSHNFAILLRHFFPCLL